MLGHVQARHEADAHGAPARTWRSTRRSCSSRQDRELADEASPGDIVGIPNHGTLRVGDTLTEGATIKFTGIPNFAPEILRRVRLERSDQDQAARKALSDLAEEGVTQVFRRVIGGDWIVGVVGQLQLEVLISRLEAEYKVDAGLEPSPFDTARWISADSRPTSRPSAANRGGMAEDRDGAPVFLAPTRGRWATSPTARPKIKFADTRERS